jgi:GDPmannose 4,6-dehydratase
LEAIRILKRERLTKIYQASTSELYGGLMSNKNANGMYDENSSFYPKSPYGVAKMYAYWITKNYRESHGLFACNGILFNHESPRRGETFVTRKITMGIAQIVTGKLDSIKLGNLDAIRDWGHASDYTEAMWLMLQQDHADDYVISTGVPTSVREFIRIAFGVLGIQIEFKGKGISEIGFIVKNDSCYNHLKTGRLVIEIDPKYFRPSEVDVLIGDCSKAKGIGWSPKISLNELIEEMVINDVRKLSPIFDRQ